MATHEGILSDVQLIVEVVFADLSRQPFRITRYILLKYTHTSHVQRS